MDDLVEELLLAFFSHGICFTRGPAIPPLAPILLLFCIGLSTVELFLVASVWCTPDSELAQTIQLLDLAIVVLYSHSPRHRGFLIRGSI